MNPAARWVKLLTTRSKLPGTILSGTLSAYRSAPTMYRAPEDINHGKENELVARCHCIDKPDRREGEYGLRHEEIDLGMSDVRRSKKVRV
jgi:hypothetical protein